MNEINKLRQRLTNVNRNVTEFRLSVQDARDLISDIDNELVKLVNLGSVINKTIAEPVAIQHVVMDGGSFDNQPGFSPPVFKLPGGSLT